jgi:hypothetical protein
MPLYFFHVRSAHQSINPDGIELPDIKAAWHEATTAAGELLKELDGNLKPGQEWCLSVADEFENPLFEIHINLTARVSVS